MDHFESPYRVLYRKDSDFYTNVGPIIEIGNYDEMPAPGTVTLYPLNINGALEDIFARFNRGSGREWDMPPTMRSLSVGDVVVIGEMAFACDRSGWSSVFFREHVAP
jgi:hypothetical protein